MSEFALPADQNSVPSTHNRQLTVAVTPAPGDFLPSFDLHGYLRACVHTLFLSYMKIKYEITLHKHSLNVDY